jgi:hypothetical protein
VYVSQISITGPQVVPDLNKNYYYYLEGTNGGLSSYALPPTYYPFQKITFCNDASHHTHLTTSISVFISGDPPTHTIQLNKNNIFQLIRVTATLWLIVSKQ